MDPDTALAQMRDLASRYGHEDHGNDEDHDIALRMVEVFQGLDTWIANGGFLPTEWNLRTAGERCPACGVGPDDLDGG